MVKMIRCNDDVLAYFGLDPAKYDLGVLQKRLFRGSTCGANVDFLAPDEAKVIEQQEWYAEVEAGIAGLAIRVLKGPQGTCEPTQAPQEVQDYISLRHGSKRLIQATRHDLEHEVMRCFDNIDIKRVKGEKGVEYHITFTLDILIPSKSGGVRFGSIVEGVDGDGVTTDPLLYPFPATLIGKTLDYIEGEVDIIWAEKDAKEVS